MVQCNRTCSLRPSHVQPFNALCQARPHLATLDAAITELTTRASLSMPNELYYGPAFQPRPDVSLQMSCPPVTQTQSITVTGPVSAAWSTESAAVPKLHIGEAFAGPKTPEGPLDWLEAFLAANPFDQAEEWGSDGESVALLGQNGSGGSSPDHFFDPTAYDLP